MSADPRMADWTGPIDETYFAERERRSNGPAAEPTPIRPAERELNAEEQAELEWLTALEARETAGAAARTRGNPAHVAWIMKQLADPIYSRPGARVAYPPELEIPPYPYNPTPEEDAAREAFRALEMRIRAQDKAFAGLEAMTWADILALPPDPPAVIRPGVPEIGVTVVAGAPKAGKTLWVSQVALESGRDTLMVIEEGSREGISYRLRHQAAMLGVAHPPIHLALRQRIRLDDSGAIERLVAWVDAALIKPGIVIFDPLNRLHSADENRPSDMTRVMDGLAEIAYRCEVAVIAVHHLAKPSAERRGDIWDRFRGASSIRSGTDANLVMDGNGDRVHLVGEFRDAEPLSEWMELDRESLTFRSVEAPVIVGKIEIVALRAFLAGKDRVTVREVMDRFDVKSKATAIKAIESLDGIDWFEGLRGQRFYTLGTVQ